MNLYDFHLCGYSSNLGFYCWVFWKLKKRLFLLINGIKFFLFWLDVILNGSIRRFMIKVFVFSWFVVLSFEFRVPIFGLFPLRHAGRPVSCGTVLAFHYPLYLLSPFSEIMSWRNSRIRILLHSPIRVLFFGMIQHLIFFCQFTIISTLSIHSSSFEDFVSCLLKRFPFGFPLVVLLVFPPILFNSELWNLFNFYFDLPLPLILPLLNLPLSPFCPISGTMLLDSEILSEEAITS